MGGRGGSESGCTQEERSNSMNSSAFSCGDRSVVTQPVGQGRPPMSPAETWMSVNTVRPHSMPTGAATGVLKVKYCTAWGVVLLIHWRDTSGFTAVTVCLPSLMVIWPRVIEACTLTSHSARAAPLGKVVSMLVVNGSGRFPWRTQVATVG